MKTPARPIGQDPQSQMLWYVSKQLEELKKIVSSSSGGSTTALEDIELSVDELKATQIDGTQKTQVVNSAGVSSDAIYRTFELIITRPANQTPYTLGDCIGNASEALPKFLSVAKAAGLGVNISNVRAKTTDTALAGKAIKVHFFKNTITPVADNAAFSIPDVTKYADYAEITFGASGSLSAFATSKTENIILNPVGVDIPVQVETADFTPSANSTTITLEIGVILTA